MTHAHAYGPPGFRGLLAMSGGRGRGRPGGGRHAGPGFGPWGGPPFGGPPFWRRGRRPRGDVRAAMLLVLAEEPLSGYGLMQEIENRSEGVWRPSPGSVYPVLAQLEDEGLIRAEEHDGRKRFVLTDDGKAYVDEHRDELGQPWAGLGDEVGEGRLELRSQIGQLAAAVHQVAAAGNDEHIEQARKVLDDARRSLYRILAGDKSD
ncbi:MAG: PadR family transcriptional regulator [Thermoleophilaceae bacterium]